MYFNIHKRNVLLMNSIQKSCKMDWNSGRIRLFWATKNLFRTNRCLILVRGTLNSDGQGKILDLKVFMVAVEQLNNNIDIYTVVGIWFITQYTYVSHFINSWHSVYTHLQSIPHSFRSKLVADVRWMHRGCGKSQEQTKEWRGEKLSKSFEKISHCFCSRSTKLSSALLSNITFRRARLCFSQEGEGDLLSVRMYIYTCLVCRT